MKLIFSFLILFNLQARDIVFISHSLNSPELKVLKRVLSEKLKISDNYIKYKQSRDPCFETPRGVIHLCFESLNNWIVLTRNQKLIDKTIIKYGVF